MEIKSSSLEILSNLDQNYIIAFLSASFILAYLLQVRRLRLDRFNQIHSRLGHLLHHSNQQNHSMSYNDARLIMALASEWDFPFTVYMSLSLALFQTYAVPTISILLARTGRLGASPCVGRRAEDTVVLLKEIEAHGPDSKRGALALARINFIHSLFGKAISRDDLLFTLCLFIFEPCRLVDWLEWRPMSQLEKQARFVHWREVGRRMGIDNLPDDRELLQNWFDDYRNSVVLFAKSNVQIGEATFDLFLNPFPARFRPIIRQALLVLVPDDIIAGFGWSRASPNWLYTLIPALCRLRALFIRHLCLPRKTPFDYGTRDPTNVAFHKDKQQTFYKRSTWLFEPYYVPQSFVKSLWALLRQPVPSPKFLSHGYAIESLGPDDLSHKGLQEVVNDAQQMVDLKSSYVYHRFQSKSSLVDQEL